MLLLFFGQSSTVFLKGSAGVTSAVAGVLTNPGPTGSPQGLLLALTYTPLPAIWLASDGHAALMARGVPSGATALPGHTSIAAKSHNTFGGKAGISGRAQTDSSAKTGIAPRAPLAASGFAGTAARATTTLTARMAAKASSAVFAASSALLHSVALAATVTLAVRETGGQIIAKTALAARSSIATIGQMATPGAILLLASAFIKNSAKTAIAGATALAASAKVQSSGGGKLAGTAVMAAATQIASFASLVKAGSIALVARCFIAPATAAGIAAKTSLTAAAHIAGAAQGTVNQVVLLRSIVKLASKAKTAIAGSVALSAATSSTARMAGRLTAYVPMVAISGLTLIRTALQGLLALPPITRTTRLYPRLVNIARAIPPSGATDQLGGIGYAGMAENPANGDVQGETILATNVRASIQATREGRKKDSSLPSDAVWAPTWVIYIPKAAAAKGTIRDRDVIYDDEGYRYEVGQAYWNLLGYRLTCIRMEG